MATYDMPAISYIRAAKFGLKTNTQTFTSPLTQQVQRAELGGARWFATYEVKPTTRAEAATVLAFLVKLRGAANLFNGYDPSGATPRGTATGTPMVSGGGQVGTQLLTDGWTPSITALKAGDYFSVNGELKMVVQDCSADSGGVATITFEPALRASPIDNAPITVTGATCTMRLIDDDQASWDVDEASLFGISFSGVEAFI